MRAEIVAVVVFSVEFTFICKFHVDGFQDHFAVRTPVSHEQDPGVTSFSKDVLDVIFTGYVNIIQFLFLDVVYTKSFFSVSHFAYSFTAKSETEIKQYFHCNVFYLNDKKGGKKNQVNWISSVTCKCISSDTLLETGGSLNFVSYYTLS